MLAILGKGKRSSHRITACPIQHQNQHHPLCLTGFGIKDIKGKLVSIRNPDITNLEQAAVSVDGLDDMLCHKLAAHASLLPDIWIVIPEVCTPPSQGGNAAPRFKVAKPGLGFQQFDGGTDLDTIGMQ